MRYTLALVPLFTSCVLFVGPPVEVSHEEQITETGVRYLDTLTGTGAPVEPTDRVTVHYTAKVAGGASVDSTYDRGIPEIFVLETAPLLGWADGIPGMRKNGKRWLCVPPHRAFGDEGVEGLVPPGAILEFEIELIDVESQDR